MADLARKAQTLLPKKDVRSMMKEVQKQRSASSTSTPTKQGMSLSTPDQSVKISTSSPGAVKSPWARYNSLGQLSCIACGTPIKNDLLWPAHIQSKRHKEIVQNAQQIKAPVSLISNSSTTTNFSPAPPTTTPSSLSLLGYDEEENEEDSKKILEEDVTITRDDQDQQTIADEQSTKSSGIDHDHQQTSSLSNLPVGFFDEQTEVNAKVEDTTAGKGAKRGPGAMPELPEDFFDDRKKDAKVRKLEVQDELEAELESFKKEIQKESVVSDKIQEEEMLEMAQERDSYEAIEQQAYLTRVELLRRAKQFVLTNRVPDQPASSSAVTNQSTINPPVSTQTTTISTTTTTKTSTSTSILATTTGTIPTLTNAAVSEDDDSDIEIDLMDWRAKKIW